MLTTIKIQNFAIIDEIELELESGMTVITGETGAGKSLLVDTLSLVLGDRADSNIIKNGTERCTITAIFDITNLLSAQQWLIANEFDNHTINNANVNNSNINASLTDNTKTCECIIYRSFSKDGRSRSSINGSPCTLQAVKDLGNLLVDIHGQHEHHSLLKNETQRNLLDSYANNENLTTKIRQLYISWQKMQKELAVINENSRDSSDKIELLNYQLQELSTLLPSPTNKQELAKIQQEHNLLSNIAELINCCQTISAIITENENINILTQLNAVKNYLDKIKVKDNRIENVYQLVESATIDLEESLSELHHYLGHLEPNQERLHQLTTQLQNIYNLAHKHKVKPEELPNIYDTLQIQLKQLLTIDQKLSQLNEQIARCEDEYCYLATQLSKTRQMAAINLSQLITDKMQQLGMPEGKFQAKIINNHINSDSNNNSSIDNRTNNNRNRYENQKCSNSDSSTDSFTNKTTINPSITPYGFENIEFQVSANTGQPLQPLNRVASGGELSRISLALQVILASKANTPTLIFDEVDVGIGGKVAEIVGISLQKLSKKNQVICVTHLPQVASCGEHHLKVEKYSIGAVDNNDDNNNQNQEQSKNQQIKPQNTPTKLTVRKLQSKERIKEIARMLGGINITQRTLDHAQEMLER